MAKVQLGTIYEINKQIINQGQPLDPIEYNKKLNQVSGYMSDKQTYFILVNNETHYYTLFNCKNADWDNITLKLSEILHSLGEVMDIIKQSEGDAYEIWIRNPQLNDSFVYYLADWSQGVIEC